jgi:pimeloyl-ACP methyl ester carboxylesterase
MQQGLTLAALLAALAWGTLLWRAGEHGLAVAGVCIVLFGHAAVLALEFACMARVNRTDAAPTATWRQLVGAWFAEAVTAPRVFCWRQPFRSDAWPDYLPEGARGRRGLLLVHGFVCNRGLWNRWYPRLREAGVPHVAVNLEPVFGGIDDYAAIIDEAAARLLAATGLAPVVVAHSMGGLAVRHWWAGAGDTRIDRLFTLGSPHHGTWLARWAFSRNGHQMQLESPWRGELARREAASRARRITCFYSHCDNIVFPASSATLAGADNRHLAGVAHVHMADRPEPYEAVMERLRAAPPSLA